MTAGLTPAEIRTLPATIDLVTAGRALGIGRTKAYQLARDGGFPIRVLRLGCVYRVATADLLTYLRLPLSLLDPGAGGAAGGRAGDRSTGGGWPA